MLRLLPCGAFSVCRTTELYLSEHPGELHVLGGCVAALQQPGSAVDVHQTLVVVVVDGGTEHAEVELLGAGEVHVLLGDGEREREKQERGGEIRTSHRF